jgi:hypothetical protein
MQTILKSWRGERLPLVVALFTYKGHEFLAFDYFSSAAFDAPHFVVLTPKRKRLRDRRLARWRGRPPHFV